LNIGPFQVSVDRQRSEGFSKPVEGRTTPINGRDGDMVFIYQLEEDTELPDFLEYFLSETVVGFALDILETPGEFLTDCESLMVN
jgi:hypothetical protein